MKDKKKQGRLYLGFIFIFFTMLVRPCFSSGIDDWAAPIQDAQQLLDKKQYNASLIAFKRQADIGNGMAQFSVALFYDLGWGISINRVIACQWFQKAALNNIPVAMQALGQCYYEGLKVKKDRTLAYHWFIRAFEQGVADAGCQAGELLLSGEAVNLDINSGEQLCLEAAMQGSIKAQTNLAKWYFSGQYLARDYQQAFNWLQRVASDKSPSSAFLLAQFYDQGIGMNVDQIKALHWYEVAASAQYHQAYIPTALLYWQVFSTAKQHKNLLLAKSYLWAKVSASSAPLSKERKVAEQLLTQIMQYMPVTWQDELNKKVLLHLTENKS